MSLIESSATQLLHGLEQGRFSAAELAEELLAQSRKVSSLNGLAYLDADSFQQQARDSDQRRACGQAGLLDGIPLALKDNLNTCDMPTTSSTGALQGRVPPRDAAIVSRLRAAGAVLPAKTVMHELAFGITTNNATTGPARNPYDPSRIPGGSSGGTATVIAARQFPAGIGTDTGASVRLPAALCGLYGFRPTVGRYPAQGIVPLSHTRDTAGPMSRSLADIVLLDTVMAGQANRSAAPEPALNEVRLGVPRSTFWSRLDDGVGALSEQMLERLQRAGVTLVDVDLGPILDINSRVGMPIVLYEAVHELPIYLAKNGYDIGLNELMRGINSPDVKALFESITGAHAIPEAVYREAVQVHRPALQQAYADLLAQSRLDGLVFPTSPLTARAIGEDETVELNGRRVATFPTYIAHTDVGSNLGAPGISLPIGLAHGLPVGLEIEAAIGADDRLLALCRALDPLLPPTAGPRL